MSSNMRGIKGQLQILPPESKCYYKNKILTVPKVIFFFKKISVKYSFYTSIFFCKFGLRIAKDTSEFDLSLWQTGRYDIEKLTGRMLVQIPRD